MNNTCKIICTFIGQLIGSFIAYGIIAFIVMKVYGAIAPAFNLPTFSYWIYFGIIYLLSIVGRMFKQG